MTAVYMKAIADVALRGDRSVGRPLHLQIEPTTACNLNCSFCIRSRVVTKIKHLGREQFVDLFDTIRPKRVTFAGAGEPLMWPDLADAVAYASSHGAKCIVTTNFTLGSNHAVSLVRAGTEALRISIDAAEPIAYAKIRGRNLFPTILEGIQKVQEAKQALGRLRPTIAFEFVITDQNIHQAADIIDLAADHRVPMVHYRPLNLVGIEDLRGLLLGGLREDSALQWLQQAQVRALERRVSTNLDEVLHNWGFLWHRYDPKLAAENQNHAVCVYGWLQAYVSVDGEVAPCCSFYMDGKVSLGNVFKDTFDSVWNGKKYQEFRRQSRTHNYKYATCRSCDSRGLWRVICLAMRTPGFLFGQWRRGP